MVTTIIQARIGSTRLKNKMILELNGYKIIEWVLSRVLNSNESDEIVLALPFGNENDILEEYGFKYGIKVFRGSESDVLARFYEAADKYGGDDIVRVCADNPLIAASEIDRLVKFFRENEYDYAYNHIPRNNSYPDGLGAEIVSFKTLKTIHKCAAEKSQREHIFNYIWDNRNDFSIGTFNPPDSRLCHPELRLDVDTEEDYNWLCNLTVSLEMEAEEIIKIALKFRR